MKTLCAIAIIVLCICQIEASHLKRPVAMEACPKNLSPEECEKYAQERVVRQNVCAKYVVLDTLQISWSHCGPRVCYGPSGQYAAKNEDLSKPYPECCPKCDHRDAMK